MDLEKTEKSTLIRKILAIGIDEELKKYALESFKDKRVSLAKAFRSSILLYSSQK